MTIFIGDVHGKYDAYKKKTRGLSNTIQVGDMGVGFKKLDGTWRRNPPHDYMMKNNHRFIRGNHDNPRVCKFQSQWIKDGTVENDMMFIGGADSIDKNYRIPGFSWWEDEQLSHQEMVTITDIYSVVKPKIMVTHDCPKSVYSHLHPSVFFNEDDKTSRWLDILLQIHQPELWVFGHHHKSLDTVINKTRFVCLAELEIRDL